MSLFYFVKRQKQKLKRDLSKLPVPTVKRENLIVLPLFNCVHVIQIRQELQTTFLYLKHFHNVRMPHVFFRNKTK